MPKRPLLGTHLGQARRGDAEQRRSSSSDQSPRVDVVEQRAARVRRLGRVHAVAPPVRFQSTHESTVPNARSVVGARRRPRAAATRASSPRSTGRARGRCARGPAARAPAARSSSQRARGAPVLPHDRPVPRPAGAAVPHHDRLALVGDADRGDGVAVASTAATTSPSVSCTDAPDLVGVVLDPARAAGSAAGTPGRRTARRTPSASTATVRTPVVPASIARTTSATSAQRRASANVRPAARRRRAELEHVRAATRRVGREHLQQRAPLRTRRELERRRSGVVEQHGRPRAASVDDDARPSVDRAPDGSDGRGTSRRRSPGVDAPCTRRPPGRMRTELTAPADVGARADDATRLVTMRIGMLTGGGDCPGLNAVIRAVVRKGEAVYGHQLVGFRHGWRGVIEGETVELTIGTHPRPDPPRRHDPRHVAHQPVQDRRRRRRGCSTRCERERIDALIAIGGEDTLGRRARARRRGGVARRRRAEDDRQRPRRPPTSRSASTPRCRSRPTPSTACTPPPRATTG